MLGGVATGELVAGELVKILTGSFDPAPERPAVPLTLLAAVVTAVALTAAVATAVSARWARRVDTSRLREL